MDAARNLSEKSLSTKGNSSVVKYDVFLLTTTRHETEWHSVPSYQYHFKTHTSHKNHYHQQTHLHSIDDSRNGFLSDVVQPMLIGCHDHPPFKLTPCGEHHRV